MRTGELRPPMRNEWFISVAISGNGPIQANIDFGKGSPREILRELPAEPAIKDSTICGNCGHGIAMHEWHDEVTSCCLARANGSFGSKDAQPCMCPGFKPSIKPAPAAQTGEAIRIYICSCTACDADFSLPKDGRGKFPKYCPYCGSLDIAQTGELARWQAEGGK